MEPNEMLKLVLLVLLLHFYSDFNLQIGAKLDGMKQKIWSAVSAMRIWKNFIKM